jgi:hypothetical protein
MPQNLDSRWLAGLLQIFEDFTCFTEPKYRFISITKEYSIWGLHFFYHCNVVETVDTWYVYLIRIVCNLTCLVQNEENNSENDAKAQ